MSILSAPRSKVQANAGTVHCGTIETATKLGRLRYVNDLEAAIRTELAEPNTAFLSPENHFENYWKIFEMDVDLIFYLCAFCLVVALIMFTAELLTLHLRKTEEYHVYID